MSKFLKLTYHLINTRYITMISVYRGEYHIHIGKSVENHIQGFTMFGTGFFSRDASTIAIKEKEHPENYKIVTDWIKKNEDL
jgi:hypothetical protein